MPIAAAGLALGAAFYPLGYALVAYNLGGLPQAWEYFQQTQRALNAFSEQPDLATRFAHTAAQIESVFRNSFHHTLIFGEHGEVPGSGFKMALLLGAPLLMWLRAEWRRESPVLLRVLIACGVSFVAIALLFGTRLSGHHFMVLQPLAYGAFALGLAALARTPRIGLTATAAVTLPLAALVALNVGGQVKESLRLQEVRGAGLYSDAINRLAADLLARERRPFAYFPDWGLSMPVAFLTGGRIGMDSVENHDAAKRALCADRDVVVAFVNEDRAARIDVWQRALGWDAPTVDAYRQADGKVVFLLATFRGRRDGPGCGIGQCETRTRFSQWHARCQVVAPAKAGTPRRLRALPGTRPGDTGSPPSRGRRFAVTGRGGRFLLAVRQPRAAPTARYASRFASRRPRATLSRISPHTSDSDASSMRPVASTAVGSRGTRPVATYSTTTSAPNASPATANSNAKPPKNGSGRTSRKRRAIVPRMRSPSRYVDSLLAEPSGRSK